MENRDIELRSERVRKIIGQVPPVLVRSGIGVISVIVALLLATAAFVPYPETVVSDIRLIDSRDGQMFATGELPYSCITQINVGMKAEIELEGYDSREYAYRQAVVIAVSRKVISRDGRNYFDFTLSMDGLPFMQKGMKGEAFVILSEKTLLGRIME